MNSKLVFFLGPAGAGKTTLAKALASRRKCAFFDMDVLMRPASDVIMTMLGLDPNDRDSADYKKYCRDLGYRLTMDAALDNVELGVDSFVVGPFTKEAANPGWIAEELAKIGRTTEEVDVYVVLVHLANEELYRSRIEGRHLKLDEWKLRNWEQFRAALNVRSVTWPLPEGRVLKIDNSSPDVNATALELERQLYAGSAEAARP
ncbi:AAA family ATPase [Paenibacillus spiritus]|uniref:AAA family ATPase n=1 Tax=Paenibacillus spiritus TaxID=2496557 RepID=A0A5J5G8S5_9BACL|nr:MULTISPECIES: AAA family ATPase [Paenibacillus]KAA9004230.1 AAA family ATPase [Paenibacillus spiritus]